MDFHARWRDGTRAVNVLFHHDPDGEATYTGLIEGVPYSVDDETDLLDLAPPGAEVTFERGGVSVSMRRGHTGVEAHAAAVVDGRPRTGSSVTHPTPGAAIEAALHALGEIDAERTAPQVCFLCAHSDYEPSTGFGGGHLACFVADAEKYGALATSDSSRERKWGMWRDHLRYRWVDEMDTCPLWQRRPHGHGYRG
jgi:hypothetical protein